MLMLEVKDCGWWYWAASAICLWTAMAINPEAYYVAMARLASLKAA